MSETRKKLEETGKKILSASRTELYLSMRFLAVPLSSLDFCMDLSTVSVGTDASYIRFNPAYLLRLYIEDPARINRTYLHMLLHCLFRHMFDAESHKDSELWDLCCDLAVESVIDTMRLKILNRVISDFRTDLYERLEKEMGVLTAQKLYQYFLERKRDYYYESTLAQEFALDDHSFWKRMEDMPPEKDPAGALMEKAANILKPYLKEEPKVDARNFLEDTPELQVWHRKKKGQLCAFLTIDSNLPKEQMSGRLFRLSSEINKIIDNNKFKS